MFVQAYNEFTLFNYHHLSPPAQPTCVCLCSTQVEVGVGVGGGKAYIFLHRQVEATHNHRRYRYITEDIKCEKDTLAHAQRRGENETTL